MNPHREMEIVSLVLKGALRHEDSMGHSEISVPGEVQRMSAGTGIVHSETNPSDTEEVNFLQMWFMPETRGLEPSYEKKAYDRAGIKNHLLPVVAKHLESGNAATIHQDMTIYLSLLDAGKTLTYQQEKNRKIFFFTIEGDAVLDDKHILGKRDSARIANECSLAISTNEGSLFMLIDLP